MSRVRVTVAVTALLLTAVGAGCGGDDSSGSDATTDTTEVTGNERLTTEQWDTYQTSRAAFVKANTAATVTLAKCGTGSLADEADAAQVQACVGDVYSELADTTAELGTTLGSFDGTVSGACATALSGFLGYVIPFQATAEGMQKTIDDGDLDAYTSASSNLEVATEGGREEAETFEQDCAPL